ncbi:MAG: sulfatase-like hydrolase/transferase [Acidobacteria bacterium]|nr:sulfatase-like hydrolase/transferase [Acidobacteriota bacterium]
MTTSRTRLPDSFSWHALHIAALSALAFAQPLFDTVARGGEFLVAHQARGTDVVGLAIALTLLVPAVPITAVWLAGLASARLKQLLVLLTIFVLIAFQTLQVLKLFGAWSTASAVGAAAFVSVVGTTLYWRASVLRSVVSVLGISIVVVPAVFLSQNSVAKFWRSSSRARSSPAPATLSVPIVMVVFDQLPLVSLLDERGEIDAAAYPSFAALARDSTWFREATGVSDRTNHALPAIVTGRYPRRNTLPQASDHPDNLFTWLASYQLHVHEPITGLCPPRLCGSLRGTSFAAARVLAMVADLVTVYAHIVAPRELEARLPPVNQHWRDFGPPLWQRLWLQSKVEDRRAAFVQFIEHIEGGPGRPTLHFTHVLLPHEPYIYYASGRTFDGPYEPLAGLAPGDRWTSDPWPVAYNYPRELQQLQLVDRLVGTLVARLKHVGLYDPALIVITADHGASFRPGDYFKVPTTGNYADIMSVPLLIKAPNQHSAQVKDANIETIDILPTIADLLNVEVPWPTDGVSGFGGPRGDRKRVYHDDSRVMLNFRAGELSKARAEGVGRKLDLFGRPASPDRLMGLGLAARVLGQSIEAMERTHQQRFNVFLNPPSGRTAAGREMPFLPGVVSGSASAEPARHGRPQLAVAVDGTVQAVTRVHYPSQGPPVWAVLLPESVFQERSAQVEVFEIMEGAGGRLTLRETGAVSELSTDARR